MMMRRLKQGGLAIIFIGGIQPKTVRLSDTPRLCPSCGLPTARQRRVDHYISLFFIPLIPVKRGASFWSCSECGLVLDRVEPEADSFPGRGQSLVCTHCRRTLGRDFTYCPYCGHEVAGR